MNSSFKKFIIFIKMIHNVFFFLHKTISFNSYFLVTTYLMFIVCVIFKIEVHTYLFSKYF